jgi:hypothetical protein
MDFTGTTVPPQPEIQSHLALSSRGQTLSSYVMKISGCMGDGPTPSSACSVVCLRLRRPHGHRHGLHHDDTSCEHAGTFSLDDSM